MLKSARLIFSLIMVFNMSACSVSGQEDLYSYLMLHPRELKTEMANCQESVEKTQDVAARCAIVMKAAEQVMALITEQQKDPEKFGQEILQLEMIATPVANQRAQVLLAIAGLNSPE